MQVEVSYPWRDVGCLLIQHFQKEITYFWCTFYRLEYHVRYRLQMIDTPPTMKIKVILIWNQSCSPWSYDNDNNDKIIMTIMMRLSDNNLPRQLGPDSPQTDHWLSYIPTLVSSQAIWKCFQDNCMHVLSIQSSLLHWLKHMAANSKLQQILQFPLISFQCFKMINDKCSV